MLTGRKTRQVRIRLDTIEELKKHKKPGQTWDGVIKDLLSEIRKKGGEEWKESR